MDKFKLISITIVLILLSGAIIYYENLKLLIDSKKSAYIIFDSEKDKIGYIDWSKITWTQMSYSLNLILLN